MLFCCARACCRMVALTNKKDQLEFTYRLGRITHQQNRPQEAIRFYLQTVEEGQNEEYYFACNAALQIGILYEEQKKFAAAKDYYDKCLSMKPSEYKNGLHQKAKAGLNRLKGK